MHEELTEKEKEELAELEQLKIDADGQSQENYQQKNKTAESVADA